MEVLEQFEYEIKSLKKTSNNYQYSDNIDNKSKEVLNDIEKNHNTSWSIYMYERNKQSNALDKVAILYRGKKITYREMYTKAFEYAKSLKKLNFNKGDELPICISNIPEYIYIYIACNMIGVKAHFMGSYFEKDYLLSIINKSNSNTMFLSEDNYNKISSVVEQSNVNNIVLVSLSDSLMKKDGKSYNPFQEIEPEHNFASNIDYYKKISKKDIFSQEEFIRFGESYDGKVVANQSLDDIATISYTSGTTKNNHPKAVKHSNRVYITVSRFKSSDVSKMPEMKNLITKFNVPVYSHTNLSNVTDTLFCNCTYASEPFNETDFFMNSLLINKPNYCQSTIGHWLYLAKKLRQEEFKNIKMPFLMLPDVVGEGCSLGEEKFLNQMARKHSFGTSKLPFPLAPVTFTLGGGTCETGGLFFTLFHALQNKKVQIRNKNYSLGLLPVKLADYNVLNLEGDYCDVNEPGLLVVSSSANMSGYVEEELNNDIYTVDKYGKKWMKMGALGYISDPYYRSIKIKGRATDYVILSNGEFFPTYKIEEVISKDTKNILSCTVIKDDANNYICHIEKQPDSSKSIDFILSSCKDRICNEIPLEVVSKISFRVRNYLEGFPIDPSGKRSINKLKSENNIDKLISINDIDCIEDKKVEKSKIKKILLR